jgi:hypothetical protein
MEHAAYLLSSTDIQIQTVALYCCIMDMQYFLQALQGVSQRDSHGLPSDAEEGEEILNGQTFRTFA